MSPDPHVFAGAHFARLGHRRKDDAWLSRKLAAGDARWVPVWRNRNLLSCDEPLDAVLLASGALAPREEIILLGELEGELCLAIDLGEDAEQPPLAEHGQFRGLRTVGLTLPVERAALLAYAQAMVLWHRRQRFCGCCGAPTRSEQAGHVRRCTSPDCEMTAFPRIDPAIIVLVEHQGRALLGRQPGWPRGMYSTIAGFVEPGESLEDAVRREVAEECGVGVGAVVYHSSQPWPFPSSLMLGFHAEAVEPSIRLHDEELEEARWFSRDEFERCVHGGEIRVPPPLSISSRLIASWFDPARPGRLASLATKKAQA